MLSWVQTAGLSHPPSESLLERKPGRFPGLAARWGSGECSHSLPLLITGKFQTLSLTPGRSLLGLWPWRYISPSSWLVRGRPGQSCSPPHPWGAPCQSEPARRDAGRWQGPGGDSGVCTHFNQGLSQAFGREAPTAPSFPEAEGRVPPWAFVGGAGGPYLPVQSRVWGWVERWCFRLLSHGQPHRALLTKITVTMIF